MPSKLSDNPISEDKKENWCYGCDKRYTQDKCPSCKTDKYSVEQPANPTPDISDIENLISESEHTEIRNLRQYHEIWGNECPSNESPLLYVFRKDTLTTLLEQSVREARNNSLLDLEQWIKLHNLGTEMILDGIEHMVGILEEKYYIDEQAVKEGLYGRNQLMHLRLVNDKIDAQLARLDEVFGE